MFKIAILDQISQTGLSLFSTDMYRFHDINDEPDAMIVRSHSLHEINLPKSIQVIGRAGVGVNNIPVAKLTKEGVPVLNAVGANANAVKELVLAGMLIGSRNITKALDYMRQLNPSFFSDETIEANKKQFVGRELTNKTLAVIGLGAIGVKIANIALDFGMHVIGFDPLLSIHRAWELSPNVKPANTLEEALIHADFITLHVPLNIDTENMLHEKQLQMLKKNVVLLNFARKELVNEAALLKALETLPIAYYVTDFPSKPFLNHQKIICFPHLGASTFEAEENCAIMIVKQIRDYLETGNIVNSVNFPTIRLPKLKDTYRLSIVNANIPNIVAQISTKLASFSFNIVSLQNGSKDDIAYTLIDVNKKMDDTLLKDLSKIKGIIRIRIIN